MDKYALLTTSFSFCVCVCASQFVCVYMCIFMVACMQPLLFEMTLGIYLADRGWRVWRERLRLYHFHNSTQNKIKLLVLCAAAGRRRCRLRRRRHHYRTRTNNTENVFLIRKYFNYNLQCFEYLFNYSAMITIAICNYCEKGYIVLMAIIILDIRIKTFCRCTFAFIFLHYLIKLDYEFRYFW